MVASCGLGPKPIPYRSLDAERLAEAINFCLQPAAQSAAREVAERMSKENGIATAVASFHRNLPLDRMRCDLIPSEPAVWRYKKDNKSSLRLSKIAAGILVDHLRLKSTDLEQSVHSFLVFYIVHFCLLASTCSNQLTRIVEQIQKLPDHDREPAMGPRYGWRIRTPRSWH